LIFVVNADAQVTNTKSANDKSSIEDEEAQKDSLMYTHPTYNYDSYGRKDPFQSLVPVEEDEKAVIKDLFEYEQSTILGVVNSGNNSYALVADRNGASYVLRENDRVFGGYVSKITNEGIYLYIVKYGRAMTIIMRLESSKLTVYEELDSETIIRKPGINISYGKGNLDSENILIEDVTVPSLDTKTIEEEWFNTGDKKPGLLNNESNFNQSEQSDLLYLIEPQNNSSISLPYDFNWVKSNGDNNSYSLVIDDNSDFTSPIYIQEDIKTSSYLLNNVEDLPPNKDLFWKVIAYEPSGKQINCRQNIMSFQINGQND
jgi:hypothetical protein